MIDIFLSYNNMEEVLKLPVNPEKLSVDQGGNNKSYILASVGEISLGDKPLAAKISLESFFPKEGSSFWLAEDNRIFPPAKCVEMIEKWRETLKPIRLTVTGNARTLSLPCLIDSFAYWEEAGAMGDIYYRLGLKEYRWFKLQQVNNNGSATQYRITAKNQAANKEVASSYVVKKGDTLWAICQKHLGDGSKYKEVAKINNLKNPNLIYPGQVIRLQ